MTGQPFLTTRLSGYRVALEIAWGADVTNFTGSTWTWTDITTDVMLHDDDKISITIGRPDYSQQSQTSELTCILDNRTSAYSEGGLSPNWPYVRRGVPVRLRVSTDSGSTWKVRFQGSANGFTPKWDPETGRWATAELSASGPLRKLDQGTLPAKSVYSTEIPRSPAWSGLITYWPCEGGDDIQDNPALIPASGHPPLTRNPGYYDPKVANNPSNQAFPLSGPLQTSFAMAAGTPYGTEAMPSYSSTGILTIRLMVAIPGAFPTVQWQPLFYMRTTNSTVPAWQLQVSETGALRLLGMNSSGSTVRTGTAVAFNMNGAARLVQVRFDNNGSGLDTEVSTLDQHGVPGYFDQSFSSTNIGTLEGVNPIGPDFSEGGVGTTNGLIAHVSVQTSSVDIADCDTVFLGLPGETVLNRLTRLCNNHGIALTQLISPIVQATSIAEVCGPQYYDTLTNLLRETEMTGQGVLYDGLGPGLTYVSKRRREDGGNGPAALTIDASAGQLMEPFAPIDDDQVTINHCDISKRNGAQATYIDTAGPMGANIIGDYSTSLAVNPDSDVDLIHYAQWAVGVGTQAGYRYPTVSFALETNAALIPGWLACTPQGRINVTNVASVRRQHPTETIKLLLEGWHEELSAFTWRVTANTSSALPWNVVVLAAATGSTGDGICHLDTDGSQLNANAAAGATSISVKTLSGPLWVTNAADSDSFPFDIDIGGCQATVTAVGAASGSVQTFTLSAGLPRAFAGSATVGAGVPIKVWQPPVFGL